MNKKLIGVVFLVMVMCFNLLSIPINVFAKEKEPATQTSKIDVTMTADKNMLESGDKVDFKLAYKANSGHGSVKPGDQIKFKTPKWLKDFKITFPPEHFKDVVVKGNEVVATFGDDVENLIGGYVNISATVDKIESQNIETIEIEVNGKVVSKIDLNIKPKEGENKPNIVKRELLKTVDGATGMDQQGNTLSDVYAPVVGRVKEYRIYVNEAYSKMQNIRLMDEMPQGMKLIPNSLKITEVDNSNKEIDVTKSTKVYKSPTTLDIRFGNINCKYIVTYKAKIDEDFNKYTNTATLYENNKTLKSTVIVNKIEDKKVTINKRSYDTSTIKDSENQTVNVASKGQIVKYAIELNENKVDISNVKLKDFIPKGMIYLPDSLMIGKYDNEDKFTWVTNELKDKTYQTDDQVTIDFGDIKDKYIIYYSMKIEGVEDEYQNKAKVIYDNKSIETTNMVKYQMNVGAINGYKSVDKKEIKKGDDQEVIYSINFESFGVFEKGYLNVIDKLNDKVKILKVEAPDNFTVNLDKSSNTVKIVNDKKDVKYGDKLEIKIYTDFKNVENGTTVNNIANINDIPTNEVETKKGYAFEAKKVDAEDENISLEGSKFVLKNKDKKIIKKLISDESGSINSEINEAGTYYLQETEAPKGYLLENRDIEFKISEDDIGKTIKLDNIKNKKLKHADETKEENRKNRRKPTPEKVEPKVTEDGLVKPEVTKPEIHEPLTKEEPKVEDKKEPIPSTKEDPKVEDKKEPENIVKYTSPKTGDSSILGYVMTLTSVSICGVAINRRKK